MQGLTEIAKAAAIGFAIAVTSIKPYYSYIYGDHDIRLWCKDGHAQEIVDDKDFGAHFYYGEYENEVFCDHCNQCFSTLKYIKVDDEITIVYGGKVREMKCVAIETMSVDDQGHIRDKDGLYMGDSYAPCTVLYTCKGKKRLVTIWEEK